MSRQSIYNIHIISDGLGSDSFGSVRVSAETKAGSDSDTEGPMVWFEGNIWQWFSAP